MFGDQKDQRWVPADKWFEKNLANIVPEASEKDRTVECVDEEFIERFVSSKKPSLLDPKTMHVLDCVYCMHRVMVLRKAYQEQEIKRNTVKPGSVIAWLIAASLVVVAIGEISKYTTQNSPNSKMQVAVRRPVNATVNLFDAGTSRGADDRVTAEIHQVTLPATLVHLSVILPQFSDPGRYDIVVAKDAAGKEIAAQSAANTVDESGQCTVTVNMDLRKVQPGSYFLATIRGSDHGVYYYPLKIQALSKADS